MFWSFIGITAALLTSAGFVPQIIKGVKTKRLRDVSTVMMFIWILGTMLWFFYGWHLGDRIIMGANIFTCSCGFLIVFLKYHYSRVRPPSGM